MRIRKHAARILSSLSINPTQTLAAAAAAAGRRELEMHVCQLNQSPWDAMDFTPPGSVSFFPYQELEEVEEDNGFAWSGHTEEQEAAAAAVSDVSGITAAESNSWRRQVKVEVMAEQAAAEGEQRERRSEYSYAKKRSTSSCISNITKKTKRRCSSSHAAGAADVEKVEIGLEIIPPPAAAAAASTCKKNDGKGWHCKRPAQHPHSLCEYHLNQVRSYYGNGVGTGHAVHHRHHQQQQALPKAPQDAALIPDNNKKKKNKKNKTTTTAKKGSSCSSGGHKSSDGAGGRRRWRTEADFFYYYSGFGPWRGKRRYCGGADSDRGGRWSSNNLDGSVDGDDHEQRDATAEAAPPDHGAHSPSPAVHDQAPDDLDDDDEDMDGGDGVGSRDGGDDVAAGRRRARKPIKARSLKSLL